MTDTANTIERRVPGWAVLNNDGTHHTEFSYCDVWPEPEDTARSFAATTGGTAVPCEVVYRVAAPALEEASESGRKFRWNRKEQCPEYYDKTEESWIGLNAPCYDGFTNWGASGFAALARLMARVKQEGK